MSRSAHMLEVIRPVRAATPAAARARSKQVLRAVTANGSRAAQRSAQSATRRIVESINTAIVERRLMPGTKLAEQKIADIFKVSRTIVRQALHQLSRDKLVTLEPARGAKVAQPSMEEARQVFEVRRMLETAMIKRAAAELTPQHIAELRAHLRDEQAAVQRTDVSGRNQLLADFHVVLARMLGNDALAEILQDLVSRCSLISLMYPSAHSAEHSFDEHVGLVDALEKHDARAAARLMQAHLNNVERNLRLDPRVPDLQSALLPAS
ncbi:MAG TPA: GntR family transcriptional regulator [Rhizobacter sp.]|nr:GntR family transcriptional regulator [Rhizobacter sp.]